VALAGNNCCSTVAVVADIAEAVVDIVEAVVVVDIAEAVVGTIAPVNIAVVAVDSC
jgi:hypothetical protein